MERKLQKLEMLRGFAALYVFASHFFPARVLSKETGVGFVFRFGQEAVMLFFLLSGFVVYYSTAQHSDQSFRTYFVRRARRIYPIFLLALVVSFASFASSSERTAANIPLTQVLGNIFMLQDLSGGKPGVWFPTLCGNTALWSLSYEWWFYMLFFPIYRFVPTRPRIHVAAGLSLLGLFFFWLHPNQASLFLMYFILWWTGAELARAYLDRAPLTFTSQSRSIVYLLLFCTLLAAPVVLGVVRHQPLAFGLHPILELRHFVACLLFLAISLLWARSRWVGFESIFGVFTLVTPISYALYVFHMPLAITSSYLSAIPYPVALVGYVTILFVAAYLAEVPFQNRINRATNSWIRRPNRLLHPADVAVPRVSPDHLPASPLLPISGRTTSDTER